MKTIIRIQIFSSDQPELMEHLNVRFPEGIHKTRKGVITAFIIEGDTSSPNIQSIVKYIESKGYTFTNYVRDYSKEVLGEFKFLYDKSDFDAADFLYIDCKKSDGTRGGDGQIIDGRAKVDVLPSKFRYCISQRVFLISPAVKQKLEKEAFIGPIFLPVDHLPKKSRISKPLDNVFALYSSIKLPPPAGWNEFREDTYDQSKLGPLIPFDLALTFETEGFCETVHELVCSQRFYRFWEANFGDVEYRPVRVRDDESVPLKTPYVDHGGR